MVAIREDDKMENENDLIQKYNQLVDKVHAMLNMPARDVLSTLSDDELFIFVGG